MTSINQLKMLWHNEFWYQPIDGLAEYNGEKVYFKLKDKGEILNSGEECPDHKVYDIINNYCGDMGPGEPDDIEEEVMTQDKIGSTKDYEVFRYDAFAIKKKKYHN